MALVGVSTRLKLYDFALPVPLVSLRTDRAAMLVRRLHILGLIVQLSVMVELSLHFRDVVRVRLHQRHAPNVVIFLGNRFLYLLDLFAKGNFL